jgi:ribonuclease D
MSPLITRAQDFDPLMRQLGGEGLFAIDTEFERERTYWPKLQLIQVAGKDVTAVIDPLALESLDPLYDLLRDPAIVKVTHAGRQDAEIFFNRMHAPPANLYDTQIAAAFLGYGDQIGYAALVHRLLGVRLRKTERVTDWSIRPLSAGQIEYALADVRHLLELRQRMNAKLEGKGRLGWLEEELAFYADPHFYTEDPKRAWMRVSGWRGLDRRGLGVLRELTMWRESEAARRDIPRVRVLPDDVLIDIAARSPRAVSDLAPLRRLSSRELEKSGSAILRAVSAGLGLPESELPVPSSVPREDPDRALIADLLSVLLRRRARDMEIAPSLLGNRRDLEDLVEWLSGPRTEPEPALLHGWRSELVGRQLAALWDGRSALVVEGTPRTVTVRDRKNSGSH